VDHLWLGVRPSVFFVIGAYYFVVFLFFNATSPTVIYTLSLHDALPILQSMKQILSLVPDGYLAAKWSTGRGIVSCCRLVGRYTRSEEHTSELQSRFELVCRLLLEKKKHEAQHRPPVIGAQVADEDVCTR